MDEKTLEILGDRLTKNIDKANEYFLESISKTIKQIRDLTPRQAQRLIQILKYGGTYDDIVNEISRLTKLDKKEINEIFEIYSKNDLDFAKRFYEYRNIPYVPFDENIALKRQTRALANITANAMTNFTRQRALGYVIRDINGVPKFWGLKEAYEKVLDEALLNVSQGKDTFNQSMIRILQELGESGIKTLEYESGRTYRLDSMVRMHLKDGLRALHNENQKLFGEEYDADGVEISVHLNPAPDHEDAQGRQFSINQYDDKHNLIKEGEFEKLQMFGSAVDYTGKHIDMHLTNSKGESYLSHRPISQYNCYHETFSIVLGVSKPRYSDKELKQIKETNEKGFDYNGKHYTMYEGTQLQRAIERKIREQKDVQILARASDNADLINKSQRKITLLTKKYKELNAISGLKYKANRLRVSGYKRV